MTNIETIDYCLESLTSNDKIDLYERWAREYKQRYYFNQIIVSENKPQEHSNYPGFESNFRALLWNLLDGKKLNPHGEWPYASQIEDSTERVDIHAKITATELWFELGMYASDERAKYSKDFEKLKAIVNSSKADNVGILVHFEVFKKGKVSTIFNEYKKNDQAGIAIHYRELKMDDRLVICRLILTKKDTTI